MTVNLQHHLQPPHQKPLIQTQLRKLRMQIIAMEKKTAYTHIQIVLNITSVTVET